MKVLDPDMTYHFRPVDSTQRLNKIMLWLNIMLRIKKIKIIRQVISETNRLYFSYTVYHVKVDGFIQEFNTLKDAKDFVKYVKKVKGGYNSYIN